MIKRVEMLGLNHCSTCVKAREALEAEGWTVAFRDVKDQPLAEADWQRLLEEFGEKLVNRASLTWRGMSEEERAAAPLAQLRGKPSLMKRPAIINGDQRLLGWTANVKRALGVPA